MCDIVQTTRDHRRVPLDYSREAPPIWMITDGCATGVSGVVSQGLGWQSANITAFYSAKLNPAQQNYPVHEIKMLAGIKTMLLLNMETCGVPARTEGQTRTGKTGKCTEGERCGLNICVVPSLNRRVPFNLRRRERETREERTSGS